MEYHFLGLATCLLAIFVMSTGFTHLANMLSGSEAVSTIGKTVELTAGENVVTGQVQAVTRGANPQIIVNGMPYSMEQINKIYGN